MTNEIKNNLLKDDELTFAIQNYAEIIDQYLKTKDVGVSFFANSEEYVDKIESIKKTYLKYSSDKGSFADNDFGVSVYQDFSIGKHLLTDCNVCYLDDKVFLKIITPFTRSRSYDFIIARNDEIENILKELHIRSEKANFKIFDFPVIGLDFEAIKKNTIDFLLNEKFRDFCRDKRIQLKRGLVFEGVPGTGKTLSLRWLKDQALKSKISFTIFKSPKDFLNNRSEYYEEGKKIFVFEDFDQYLQERKETNHSPNTILASILNTLEGIDVVQDVVSIFTTNKIDLFDSAFLRPGRIDKVYTYELPKEKEIKEFLDVYISDIDILIREKMIKFLIHINCNVSYAILKGICDDINIYMFNKSQINYVIAEEIMKEKIKGSNKNSSVKDKQDFIL